MGHVARKPVFGGLRTTKAQISLRSLISAFVIRLLKSIISKLCYKQIFNFLAKLCSCGDWFESRFVGNPEDLFCRDEAHIMYGR